MGVQFNYRRRHSGTVVSWGPDFSASLCANRYLVRMVKSKEG